MRSFSYHLNGHTSGDFAERNDFPYTEVRADILKVRLKKKKAHFVEMKTEISY